MKQLMGNKNGRVAQRVANPDLDPIHREQLRDEWPLERLLEYFDALDPSHDVITEDPIIYMMFPSTNRVYIIRDKSKYSAFRKVLLHSPDLQDVLRIMFNWDSESTFDRIVCNIPMIGELDDGDDKLIFIEYGTPAIKSARSVG